MFRLLFMAIACLLATGSFAQVDPNIFDNFSPSFQNINGYKINVETAGTGDPIFFFAGGPGNSHDYMEGNFGQYYKTHQVVFIDMLGRGMSDDAKDPSEYSVDNDVEIAEAIRKNLNLDKIALVGHSYGTVVAQAYAIKYPENVSRMLLINGFHSGEMWQANCDSYNHYAKTHFPEKWAQVDSMRALGYVSSDPAFSDLYGSFPVKYIYYHNTALRQNVPKSKFRGWSSDVYYSIIGRDADFDVSGSMINQDYRRALKDLKFPTLIVAGRYDGVSTPEYAIQYKQFMPQAEFVMFEHSAHNPYLEEPEKFYGLMDKFFGVKEKTDYKPEDTEVWEPEPKVINPGESFQAAPADAIVLFDGTNTNAWQDAEGNPIQWKLDKGVMTVKRGTGDIFSKQQFGDLQLHLEWRCPAPETRQGPGQGQGNSGLFFQKRYEIQILDSYNNRTYSNGQAGAIYKQSPPLVNAMRSPGEWNTYDIIFHAPKFDRNGRKIKSATITAIHNGVLVQDNFEIQGTTEYIGLPKNLAHGDDSITLQDHGDAVSYRNIWVRKL